MKKIILFLSAFLILSPFVFAEPLFTMDDDQTYSEKSGLTELKYFNITDINGGEITKDFGIKINLPEEFPAIFSINSLESAVVFGSAVDNGRMDENVKPVIQNKGKSVFFEVKESFKAGEVVTIKSLFLKDVYSSSNSTYPTLEYAEGKTASSPKYFASRSSSNQDGRSPDTPYNPKAEITENNKVKLTWEDSYDLDLSQIIILRGKNALASGTPYTYLGKGEEIFIDENVKIGDKMEYYISATDGRNQSELGEKLEITVVQYVAPTETETSTEGTVVPETPVDSNTNETDTTVTPEENEEISTEITKREEIRKTAENIIKIEYPLERINAVREEMAKLKFKDKPWLMRYIIEIRN